MIGSCDKYGHEATQDDDGNKFCLWCKTPLSWTKEELEED